MTIVLARELERIGVRVNAIAPVARTRLTEAVAGDHMKPDDGGFDRFAPENVAAVAVLAGVRPRRRASPARWSRCRAASCSCSQGWRPLTEATVGQAVDDRRASTPAATALLAKADAGDPAVLLPVAPARAEPA